MIIDFFKSDHPRAIFVLPIVLLGFWCFAFIDIEAVTESVDMPLYELIRNMLGYSYLSKILAIILIFIEALLLNRIVMSRNVYSKNSYLPSLLYVVLMSSFPSMLYLNPVLIANLILILALGKMFKIDNEEKYFSNVFDASVLVGIASLIYFPAIIFSLFIFCCLFFISRSGLREKLITIVGIALPHTFAFVYYFWIDGTENYWTDKVFNPIIDRQSFQMFDSRYYVPLFLLFLLTFLSFKKLYRGIANSSIQTKRILSVLISFFAFSALSFLLTQSYSVEYFLFLAIPLSIYFTNYFLFTKKRWLAEFVFVLLIGTLIYNHISEI
ncbi:MAG: hypothetical protein HRT71_05125 [Flavobacteriales bacterium]|nr:hypothetical protein [Flavobacteriales bacterium]